MPGKGIERFDAALHDMFPVPLTIEKVDNVKTLTEAYHKYKREYVKQLIFTPEEENLSKFIYKRLTMAK